MRQTGVGRPVFLVVRDSTYKKIFLIDLLHFWLTEFTMIISHLIIFLSMNKIHYTPSLQLFHVNNYFVTSVTRIKYKFKMFDYQPVLLPKNCEKVGHCGTIYSVLRHFRKEFCIIQYIFSVEKMLKSCVVSRRINAKDVKTNQIAIGNV